MENQPIDPQFFIQFFQEQRQNEQQQTPDFASMFVKAQLQHKKMQRTKRLLLVLVVGLILAITIFSVSNWSSGYSKEIPVLKASFTLFNDLMEDGKIITYDIHFDFGTDKIKSGSMPVIQSLAEMMKTHREVRLHIEGHTDDRGDADYNQQLSATRAAAVKQALTDLSVEASRLSSAGYGETRPISDNNTDQGRALNRRVEIILIK